MPTDSRRITGPEESQSYELFVSSDCKKKKNENVQLLKNGKRQDGRELRETRSIFIDTGIITQAKGSGYMELGRTKVICTVYGPREIPKHSDFSIKGVLHCTLKCAPFSSSQRRGYMNNSDTKEYGLLLEEALQSAVCLHLFPKSQVDVYVYVLEDDGSLLSAAITCSCLALADAEIPLYAFVIGASLSHWGDNTFLDPATVEEYHPSASHIDKVATHGNMTIAYMPFLNQMASCFQEGNMEVDSIISALNVLCDMCVKIFPLVQNCLIKEPQQVKDEAKKIITASGEITVTSSKTT